MDWDFGKITVPSLSFSSMRLVGAVVDEEFVDADLLWSLMTRSTVLVYERERVVDYWFGI